MPKSYQIPREMYHVNILGTLNMLELCRVNQAKMVFTSSYVYGKPKYLPIDEEHPTSSFNPYSKSKLIGESLCESYYQDFSVPVIVFRPFNIYGMGQRESFLIPVIIEQIREKKCVQLKDPRPKRDYIHIDDVVKAFSKAVNYRNKEYNIFNLGTGESYSVKELVEMVVELTGQKILVEYTGQKRPNEVLDTIANISKVREKLGWTPEVNLEAGIRKTLEYQS